VAAGVEQVYRYPQPSTVGVVDGRVDVQLSTSGGTTGAGPALHPRFFDGFLAHPEQTATGLLTVARVARSRFYVPPGMLSAILRAADPVVTSNGDRLRFESFSACCGVHARLDRMTGDARRRALAGHGHSAVEQLLAMRRIARRRTTRPTGRKQRDDNTKNEYVCAPAIYIHLFSSQIDTP